MPQHAVLRIERADIIESVRNAAPIILEELSRGTHSAAVAINPGGHTTTSRSSLLSLIFARYDPKNLGIIDFHGPNRNYAREQLGGINLSLAAGDERMRNHALYNYSNKYANLKSEIAASYVRHLLAREADPGLPMDDSLSETLQELFETFFPGKQFVGPKPTSDGRLLFNVRTPNGSEHDIDDLSTGEKEVLYGYLRLRNAAPRNSVLLIDEPELHLNPRLIHGLAAFYHRHLATALGSQLWLVTHSDTLIREAVGEAGFSVFHLQAAGQYDGDNQISEVSVGQPVEELIISLIGDLASYRPGAKMIIFEGDDETKLDCQLVSTLFPEFANEVNMIAGGSKVRVSNLYELLDKARRVGQLPGRFYAIVDADGAPGSGLHGPTTYEWDAYHIENYLLEPEYLRIVLNDLNLANGAVKDVKSVDTALLECARHTVPKFIGQLIEKRVNRDLVGHINLRFDPGRQDVGRALSEAAAKSGKLVSRHIASSLSPAALEAEQHEMQAKFDLELADGSWRKTLRGREILTRFVSLYGGGLSYLRFRDLIIARMRDAHFMPLGMASVLNKISAHRWND